MTERVEALLTALKASETALIFHCGGGGEVLEACLGPGPGEPMGAFADVKLNLAQRGRAETLIGDILDDPLAAAYELIWRRDVIQADRDRLRAAMLPFAHLELATHYADALPIGLLVGAKAEYPHVTARQLRELHAAYRASQDEA